MKHLKKMNESDNENGLQKVVVYYGCFGGGDGSVHLRWYLDGKTASEEEESQSEGWGEDCTGSVETFIGSDIHKKAIKNEEGLKNSPERASLKEMENVDPGDIENWLDNYFKKFDSDKGGRNWINQLKDDAKRKLEILCNRLHNNRNEWRTAIRNFRF